MKSAVKPQDPKTKTRVPVLPITANTRTPKAPPTAQLKASGQAAGSSKGPKTGSPVRQPAAAPAYRPQPVPKVLQTKMATAQPARDARKTPPAPPVYRPQQPRIQAKFVDRTHRTNLTQRGVIQRHPMIITIGKTSTHLDTSQFESIHDVTRHLPDGAASYAVTEVHIRKESNADHQYVIALTNGGINLKMHLGTAGAEIKCSPGISATFGLDRGRFTPKRGMTLGDAVGIFYQLAHVHAFESDNYNCARFAADLAASLGTYIREKGDDFDAFF